MSLDKTNPFAKHIAGEKEFRAMATPKPEDISVLLGRIRTTAERVVTREKRLCDHAEIVALDQMDALSILELIEQAQKVVLEAQLSASIKARS